MSQASHEHAHALSSDAVFELKSGPFTLLTLSLKSPDIQEFEHWLHKRFGHLTGFFEHEPVVLDLDALKHSDPVLDFPRLRQRLRTHQLHLVAIRHGSATHQAHALAAGLALLPDQPTREAASKPLPPPVIEPPPMPELAPPAPPPAPARSISKIVTRPVRTGQQIYAEGGDLVLLAGVAAGAEVLADGNVHVYGPLHGRALAGVQGDESARIFTQSMDASLVSIAGIYRNIEEPLPAEVQGKPAQIYLEGTRLIIAPLVNH